MESTPYLHCGWNSASFISIGADILHFFTYFELFNKILDHGISKQIQKIAQFFLHSLNEFSELHEWKKAFCRGVWLWFSESGTKFVWTSCLIGWCHTRSSLCDGYLNIRSIIHERVFSIAKIGERKGWQQAISPNAVCGWFG